MSSHIKLYNLINCGFSTAVLAAANRICLRRTARYVVSLVIHLSCRWCCSDVVVVCGVMVLLAVVVVSLVVVVALLVVCWYGCVVDGVDLVLLL